MGSTLWQFLSLDDAAQRFLVSPQGFNFTLQQGCHTFYGMTMAFHKDLKPVLHPAPEGLAHDYWVGILASALNRLCLVNKPLADYRQHSKQTSGSKGTSFWSSFKRRYLAIQKLRNPFFYKVISEEHREIRSRLLEVTDFPLHPEAVEILDSKAIYLSARAAIHQRLLFLRLPLVYREYRSGRYARFSRGWRSILVDLLL